MQISLVIQVKMVTLMAILWVYASLVASTCRCGQESLNLKVINGGPSVAGQFPWMVGVLVPTRYGHSLCGGSIINDRYILTAAHCFRNKWGSIPAYVIPNGYDLSDLKPENSLPVAYVKMHPHYNMKNGVTSPFDLAIIRLRSPIQFNATFSPICLGDIGHHDDLLLTGWGTINAPDGSYPLAPVMYQVILQERPGPKCSNWAGYVPPLKICAGGNNKSSGHGDSGGPLAVKRAGEYVQVGVVSGGGREEDVVNGEDKPDLYERISWHRSWLRINMMDAKWCPGRDHMFNIGQGDIDEDDLNPFKAIPLAHVIEGRDFPSPF